MSKARDLSDFISTATIDSTELADLSVTHAKLHATMDLSSKTVTLANDAISGNNVHGGVISNFASTGIDDNADALAITIDSSERVGIGTASPSARLHIRTTHSSTDVTAANSNSTLSIGNTAVGNGVYNAIKFAANQQDMYIMSFNHGTAASRRMGFFLGSVAGDAVADERLSILGNGNVGIGETSPQRSVVVKGANGATTSIQFQTPATGSGASDGFGVGYDSNGKGFIWNYEGNDTYIGGTTSSTSVTIDGSNGNVGIGTSTGVSSPVSRLNVRAANNHTNGSDREDLVTFHQGISAWQVGRGAGIRWVGDVSRTMAGISAYVFGVEQTGLAFETGGSNSTGNLKPTTRMVINNDGKVGIGTTSPGQKLTVAGAIESTSAQGSVAFYSTTAGSYNQQNGSGGTAWAYGSTGVNSAPNTAASTSFGFHHWNGSAWSNPFNLMTDGKLRVGGGGSADSANTQFNMEFPATGGINFGSGYTFSNIYGDATGNLFLKANAYPANTGSSSRVELRAANSGGGMSAPLVWYDNGKLGLNNLTPSFAIDTNGNSWYNSSIRMVRTDGGVSNDTGIVFKQNAGTAAGYALGGLWFVNSNYSSGDNAYALIRARTQEVGSSGKLQFITSNGAVSNTTPAKLTINHAGDFLIGGQFNYHVISGFSAPNSAFQYDFYRSTYAHPIRITTAISHWNSSYMSYKEQWVWGFNTAMTANTVKEYNGGNGSWTVSFPTNNIVRVRMNGDAGYNYASAWFIKVEGNLRREYTSS